MHIRGQRDLARKSYMNLCWRASFLNQTALKYDRDDEVDLDRPVDCLDQLFIQAISQMLD